MTSKSVLAAVLALFGLARCTEAVYDPYEAQALNRAIEERLHEM